jgi:hypothetical protein
LLAAEGSEEATFEFVVENPNTGEKQRIAVRLDEEGRKAIAATPSD